MIKAFVMRTARLATSLSTSVFANTLRTNRCARAALDSAGGTIKRSSVAGARAGTVASTTMSPIRGRANADLTTVPAHGTLPRPRRR